VKLPLVREPDHAASGAESGAEENNINETAERFGAKRQKQWIFV